MTEGITYKRGDLVMVKTDTEPRWKYLVTYVYDSTATIFQLGTGFSRQVPVKELEPTQR
jgi:hypothetical protein